MEVLNNASGAVIKQSHFSNIGGNQYNYNYYSIDKARNKRKRSEEGILDLTEPGSKRKRMKNEKSLMDLSEYREVKRGDIYKDRNVCYSWQLCSNGKDDTEVVTYYAKLNITGPFGEKEFTVRTYHGRNATKEWRRDFSRCAMDWRGDIPLFGYNRSSIPSLIFCGELIPIGQLDNQLGLVVGFYVDLLHKSLACSRNELWLDSTRGKLICGPVGPKCLNWFEAEDVRDSLPADVELLKEDVVIRYFQNAKHDWFFIKTVSYSAVFEHSNFPSPNKPATEVFSNSSKSRIACIPKNLRWRSFKSSLEDWGHMPDGTTRCRLVNNRRCVEVHSSSGRSAWLSQACNIFHSQNIGLSEDLSDFKLVEFTFFLEGAIQKCKRKLQRRELCAPIYLFCKSSSCDSGQFHFWSLDNTGQNPLTQDMCIHLGLPFKLRLQVISFQSSWPSKTYQMIRDYQVARGFDPKTTDFAHHLERPIFEVVSSRFEELLEVQEN